MSLTQDRPANTGDLNGLCFFGNDPTKPGFQYELVGTDAKGTIVERRSVCVAFEEPGVRPPPPPLPQVPTFAEAWKAAQLPAPIIVTDPATRGITGLETRIMAAGFNGFQGKPISVRELLATVREVLDKR